jgi:hypothetical protein
MGKDVQAAYEQAVKEEPRYAGIVRWGLPGPAIDTGVADGNPYDGIDANKVDLWAYDHYHGSAYGYYLEALMDFGKITGHDPLELDGKDRVAEALGISRNNPCLMQVAHDTLERRNEETCFSLLLAATPVSAKTILFVGNSFTFGANSAAHYKSDTVTD